MAYRKRLFEFGARRGMNTYLYAPKDDPYHRVRWTRPYPRRRWQALLQLIGHAHRRKIDFVYGFHPGHKLCFSEAQPVRTLLDKARRFHDAGVRTFAVLFDDIPSRLEHARDRGRFHNSLARAQATWMRKILARQPDGWRDVEWWICPSYYTPDPLLARTFGIFEPNFLEILGDLLPKNVACLWTGPKVVPRAITFEHVRGIVARVKHRLILWDNYPVNDLSMTDELHIGPLQNRDPRLPRAVYGYLNNPLLQEHLNLIPLATCFDYAAAPGAYCAEASWARIITQEYGRDALPYWRSIRRFCSAIQKAKLTKLGVRLSSKDKVALRAACAYLAKNRKAPWAHEIKPWRELMRSALL